MNDDEARSVPWQQGPDDEHTRMTPAHHEPDSGDGSGGHDDWYRSSHDDPARYEVPADPQTHGSRDAHATPGGQPSAGYPNSGYPSAGYPGQGSYGSSPMAAQPYASQPPAPQTRRAWVAPVALGVVALVSFGAVTALMSKDSSPQRATAPVVSNSVTQSATPSATTPSTSPSVSASNTVTVTTTQQPTPSAAVPTTSTEQSTATETTSSSSSTSQTATTFPPGVTGQCVVRDSAGKDKLVPNTDSDVDQTERNSCDFLVAVKNQVWSKEASSSDTTFDLKVYSAYRASRQLPDPTVALTCRRDDGFTNCSRVGEPPVDIWVRDAS